MFYTENCAICLSKCFEGDNALEDERNNAWKTEKESNRALCKRAKGKNAWHEENNAR